MIGLSRGVLVFFLAGMFGIAYLDYSTGKDLAVWGLYLIPVGIASWMGGIRAGALLSVVSCVLMFVIGIYGGNMFASTGYFLLGILNRLVALFLLTWLASYLYRRQMLESTLKSYEECMDYLHVSPSKEADPAANDPVATSGPVQVNTPSDQGR
ncbi:MAG: hypothetical protein GZ085_04590 [Sulfuriferula multivorans]|uniref:Uncharacterized protein n=1 Tax=Sulfuriferula multivorans TaxID=1559896 RepID=A0A7C9P2V1_9PROT|nr:hypothetical protein [Sulfuriferula multivorans]